MDRMYEAVCETVRQLNKLRENQIADRLTEMGYTFANNDELMRFAKERMTVVTVACDPFVELYIDYNLPSQQIVGRWKDTLSSDYDPNTSTLTTTVGE